MSRNALHTEENFWPSVSDMFLTLFVIALVLYSGMSHDKGKGDAYLAQQATMIGTELAEELKKACPNDAVIQGFDTQKLQEENTKENIKRAELAGYVMDIVQNSELRNYFDLSDCSEEELQEARADYEMAIDLAYDHYPRLQEQGTEKKPEVACEQLRKLKNELLSAMPIEIMTPKQLEQALADAHRQLRELNQRLKSYHSDEEFRALELKIKDLEALLSKTDNLQSLRDEILKSRRENDELQKQVADLKKNLIGKDTEIGILKGKLNQDTRRLVMEDVKSALQENRLLQDVQVEEDAGIIRIPSSSAYFESDESKESKLHCCRATFMAQLSQALTTIAENDKEKHLIDNIVIECHADKSGQDYYNEELSSLRALTIWSVLNRTSGSLLQNFQNSSGLGLFSHAGFGSRVPVALRPGEDSSSQAYKRRCRRIDIRFNCAPRTGNANAAE